jgi:hypothetical protein
MPESAQMLLRHARFRRADRRFQDTDRLPLPGALSVREAMLDRLRFQQENLGRTEFGFHPVYTAASRK